MYRLILVFYIIQIAVVSEIRAEEPKENNRFSVAQNLNNFVSPPNYRAEDLLPSFSQILPNVVVLGNVVCQSDFLFSETDDLCQDIYQLQEDLVRFLGIPYCEEKVELCLFADSELYISFIKEYFPGAPLDRPALYIKDNGPGVLMIKRDKNIRLNIRHEMTHAILNASLRNVPIWLDEGLAKYFEIPAGQRGYENPFLPGIKSSRFHWTLFSSVPSLPRLEKLYRVDQMLEREYKESWAWVHFLIHYSFETQQLLAQYLQTLTIEKQQNISSKDALAYQKTAPLTRMLENQIPDYKNKYIKHFNIWKEKQKQLEKQKREIITIPGTSKM